MKKLLTLNNLFLLVIFCMPLYLIKMTVFDVPTNILEILALLAIIATIIKGKKNFLIQLTKLPGLLIFSCIFILAGILVSIFFNDNWLAGFGIFKGWFIIPMLFSFALYLTLKSELSIEKIFKSIYFSAAVVGLISIAYKILGITTYDNRLSAFYLSPNHLAMYLAPGVFFGLFFLLKSFLQKQSLKKTALHFALLTMILIPLYYTYSYSAWIAVFGSLAITSLFVDCHSRVGGNPELCQTSAHGWIPHQVRDDKCIKPTLILTVLSLFLCAAVLFVFQIGTQKFSALTHFSTRSSFASRQMIWQASARLIENNPIIGIGPGNFQSSYLALQQYYPPYLEWAVPEPHNIFLAFWLQAGLFGFIGFLILLSFIFRTLWQSIKNKKSAALAAPLFGFFLYTILHGLVDTPYWKNDLAFLSWICVFLILFLLNSSSQKDF